jgi:hypothetical protein
VDTAAVAICGDAVAAARFPQAGNTAPIMLVDSMLVPQRWMSAFAAATIEDARASGDA